MCAAIHDLCTSYLVEIVTLPFLLEVVEYTSVSYRTDAGVTLACGSVVLAFICVSFFARPGEKRYTEGMNCESRHSCECAIWASCYCLAQSGALHFCASRDVQQAPKCAEGGKIVA